MTKQKNKMGRMNLPVSRCPTIGCGRVINFLDQNQGIPCNGCGKLIKDSHQVVDTRCGLVSEAPSPLTEAVKATNDFLSGKKGTLPIRRRGRRQRKQNSRIAWRSN